MLTVLDRWLDALDSVVHAVGKKLSVLALASMLTSNVPYVILFCSDIVASTNFAGSPTSATLKCVLPQLKHSTSMLHSVIFVFSYHKLK